MTVKTIKMGEADLAAMFAGEVMLIRDDAALRRFIARAITDVHASMGDDEDDDPWSYDAKKLRVDGNGIAQIRLRGLLLKSVWSGYQALGWATSTQDVAVQLERALTNPNVKGVMLSIDSPGGTVAGTTELAELVSRVAAIKPVHAHAADLMASAAYWVGSQARKLTAGSSAAVGSIGAMTAVYDFARFFENAGVKTHVIASGDLKGIGVMGAPLTEPQLADIQRVIDKYGALFIDTVAAARKLSATEAKDVATGQVWVGAEALEKRLVDGVTSSAKAYESLAAAAGIKTPSPSGASAHHQEKSTMTPEEIAALKAENEKNKARADAADALLKASDDKAKEQLVARFEDRVLPAAKAAVLKLGSTMGLEEFAKYLESLPKVVHDLPVGALRQEPAKPSLAEGEKQVARWLGTSHDKIEKFSKVKGRYANGDFIMEDGRILSTADARKELGLPAA